MPIPGPFVRFRKVYTWRLLEESTLKFLRDAKESFVGSVIHYAIDTILLNKDMRNQMHYLFEIVFHKPSYISLYGERPSDLKVLTNSLPDYARMRLQLCLVDPIPDANINHMLLDWLNIGKSVIQHPQRHTVLKHLVLEHLPRTLILDMVQQIKNAFNNKKLQLCDFLITFVESRESDYCLEGDHTFTLNKISSNERLSFFTHGNSACKDPAYGRAYRLWCRRVINEPEDLKMAIHLQNLGKWSRLGIDLYDREFYDFRYPYLALT